MVPGHLFSGGGDRFWKRMAYWDPAFLLVALALIYPLTVIVDALHIDEDIEVQGELLKNRENADASDDNGATGIAVPADQLAQTVVVKALQVHALAAVQEIVEVDHAGPCPARHAVREPSLARANPPINAYEQCRRLP